MGELAESPDIKLIPTWQCNIPLNANDFDLRPDMKEPPLVGTTLTEALFSVVRAEFADFIRHSGFHLDFFCPALKPIAKNYAKDGETSTEERGMKALEQMLETKYLQFCDPDDALQYMTIWMCRAYLAKYRLLEHHSKRSSSIPPTEAHRDIAISHAIDMLNCDTKLMHSPLTKGYQWVIHFHFPFVAYIQIVQDLRRRPVSQYAARAWDSMSENYGARFGYQYKDDSVVFFNIFPKILLQAWNVRDTVFKQKGQILQPPQFVQTLKHVMKPRMDNVKNDNVMEGQADVGKSLDEFLKSIGMDDDGMMFDIGNEVDWSGLNWPSANDISASGHMEGAYTQMPDPMSYGVSSNQYDLSGDLGLGAWPIGR